MDKSRFTTPRNRSSAFIATLGVLFVVAAAVPALASTGSGVLIPWALENENKNPTNVLMDPSNAGWIKTKTIQDSSLQSRTTPQAWFTTKLGAPLAFYAKDQGVYQRNFAHGRVLVNPTTVKVVIPLGSTYYTLARQQVTTVTLAPNVGVILTKSYIAACSSSPQPDVVGSGWLLGAQSYRPPELLSRSLPDGSES